MLDAQGWLCPICGATMTLKTAHVDHDHSTGELRGILCFNCNGGLGQFRDDLMALRRAIHYLTDGPRRLCLHLRLESSSASHLEQRFRAVLAGTAS